MNVNDMPTVFDERTAFENLPKRPSNANKGSFGKVLLYVGSEKYRGAAHLAAEAALRSGVGYVGFFGEGDLALELRMRFPELIFHEKCNKHVGVSSFFDISARYSAILTGCGSDISKEYFDELRELLSSDGSPLVLDADAINTIAAYSGREYIRASRRTVILTPHPLELSRLTGRSVDGIQSNRLRTAEEVARDLGVILLLKGQGTIVTDGRVSYLNSTGSSALAKAGSGDVLAGLVAGLLAYSKKPLEAVALAAYLHGRAGDTLAEEYSNYGVTPSDLPKAVAKELSALERLLSD